MFLAHYTGGGIQEILDMDFDEFHLYLDEALKLFELQQKLEMQPRRVVIAGIEKGR